MTSPSTTKNMGIVPILSYTFVASNVKPPDTFTASVMIYCYSILEGGREGHVLLPPRTSRIVRTGLALRASLGYNILVHSPVFLATSQPPLFIPGTPLVYSPETDMEEFLVPLYNGGHESKSVKHGDGIAQIFLSPQFQFTVERKS